MIYKGNIIDPVGDPLPGVNILIAPGKGTTTDFDGNFSFRVANPNQIIAFSYAGHEKKYKAKDIPKQITLSGEELQTVEIIAKKRKLPTPPKKDYTMQYVVGSFLLLAAITGVIIYTTRETPSVALTEGNYKSKSKLKTTKINL